MINVLTMVDDMMCLGVYLFRHEPTVPSPPIGYHLRLPQRTHAQSGPGCQLGPPTGVRERQTSCMTYCIGRAWIPNQQIVWVSVDDVLLFLVNTCSVDVLICVSCQHIFCRCVENDVLICVVSSACVVDARRWVFRFDQHAWRQSAYDFQLIDF